LRIPEHSLTRELCQQCGHAIVSTSANREGEEPAKTEEDVRKRFQNTIDFIVPGKTGPYSQASSIRDIISDEIIRA